MLLGVFICLRAVQGTFVFHRLGKSRVIWRRVWGLVGISVAYGVLLAAVAFAAIVAMRVGGLFQGYDLETIAGETILFGSLIIAILAIARWLPGTRKLASVSVVEKDGVEVFVRQASDDGADFPRPPKLEARNFLVRHWRGELSLAVSFWVNYSLPLGVFAAIVWAFYKVELFDSFRMLAAVFVAVTSAQCIAYVWMHVGTWRATRKTGIRARSNAWPFTVRTVLLLNAGAILAIGLQTFVAMAGIATGFDPYNKYTITRTSSDEVMVQGLIGSNLPGDLAPLLREGVVEQQEVDWIRLESQGGRIGPALEVARMIALMDLKTRVWDECSSACFLAFMAADVRALSPKGKIGLHAYSPEIGLSWSAKDRMERDRHRLLARGIPKAFIDKAFSTPPDDMWYPSFEELVAAGVVTHVMEGGETRPARPE